MNGAAGSPRCSAMDPQEAEELFFPEVALDTPPLVVELNIARARSICGACPVQTACLAGALVRREQYGIWGGYTTEERGKLLRQLGQRAGVAA